jgi:hypothetical protein
MIVSASFHDDIPAFYGPWFMKRLAAGYCRTFDENGLRFHRIGLDRQSVDGFVFWTRNVRPFLASLGDIRVLGFPFFVQYAITTERSDAAVADMHAIANAFGRRAAVWRYDLIALAERPPAWHAQNFEDLARALEGATDQAVVAFGADRSTEPSEHEEKRPLLRRFATLAAARGMRLSVCSQPEYLVPGASPARCIDSRRLSDIAGGEIAAETRARWPGCLCAAAWDIGAPLEKRLEAAGPALVPCRSNHDEDGEFLVPPPVRLPEADGTALPF